MNNANLTPDQEAKLVERIIDDFRTENLSKIEFCDNDRLNFCKGLRYSVEFNDFSDNILLTSIFQNGQLTINNPRLANHIRDFYRGYAKTAIIRERQLIYTTILNEGV